MDQDARLCKLSLTRHPDHPPPPQAALVSAEDWLWLATEAASIGWWYVEDGDGRLVWPPRVKAMFGIAADAPVTMADFHTGLHPDDRDPVAAAHAASADPARRALYDVEFRTIGRQDGMLRWVAARGRGVFDATGRCLRMIGTAIDITERKLAQEGVLARQREEARLRDQFIAVLGHDLKTPLASIAAATRLMLRHPHNAAALGEHVLHTGARMSGLIENILDLARGRLGGGFAVARDAAAPLEPVLRHIIEELRAVHPLLDIRLDLCLREAVTCDRQRIGQLLSNLLGNACAYGAAHAPIAVCARSEAGQFELSVTNAGDPIPPAQLERLFDRFSAADSMATAWASASASISAVKSPRRMMARSMSHPQAGRPASPSACRRARDPAATRCLTRHRFLVIGMESEDSVGTVLFPARCFSRHGAFPGAVLFPARCCCRHGVVPATG